MAERPEEGSRTRDQQKQTKADENRAKLAVKAALKPLRLDELEVDRSYQREEKHTVRKIAANFDKVALGVPLVCQREDGTYWVVDGQQRIAALRILGWPTVRCEVFRSSGPEHEAEVFKLVNLDRLRLTPVEEFRSLLATGDETAWAIKEAVEAEGYKLGTDRKSGSRNNSRGNDSKTVLCLGTLQRVAREKTQGIASIRFALRTAEACWPGDTMGINKNMASGLVKFWGRLKGVVDEERLVPRLRTTTPHKILYTASQQAVSGTKASAVADVIGRLYVKRLQGNGRTTPS